MNFQPVIDPAFKPCKICGAKADLYGVVDFHKSCLESKGLKLSLSGIPVYYRRCVECRFVFTDAFDDWGHEEFQRRIYNADYARIDPDYADDRPAKNAAFLNPVLQAYNKADVRLLDYGGGNGALTDSLRKNGYKAETFDPFSRYSARPAEKYDVVTAFEVMEHAVRPQETLNDMLSFLNRDGFILFSTLLQPPEFDQIALSWWYVGPRNGHISIFSRAALQRLLKDKGLSFVSISPGLHVACYENSAFAAGPMEQLKRLATAA